MGRLFLQVKVGDQAQGQPFGKKDGMVIDYIDEDEWGVDFKFSDWTKKCFAVVEVDRSLKPSLSAMLKEHDTTLTESRDRTNRIELSDLAGLVGDADLEDKWRSKSDIVPIVDARGKRFTDIVKPTADYDYKVGMMDLNAVASGSYTIGSGAQNYATISAFEADLANPLTGDITGTLETAITQTAICIFNTSYATYTCRITSDTPTYGDITAGHLVTGNFDDQIFGITGTTGTLQFDSFRFIQTAAQPGGQRRFIRCNSTKTLIMRDLYIDGNSILNHFIYFLDNGTANIYNCCFFDLLSGACESGGGPHAGQNFYNNFVYNCENGFDFNDGTGICYSNISFDSGTADYVDGGNMTIANCADSDSTLPAGSGNKRGLTAAAEVETTSTEANFGHPLSNAVNVAKGGNTTHGSTRDISNGLWLPDPSIGFKQVLFGGGGVGGAALQVSNQLAIGLI